MQRAGRKPLGLITARHTIWQAASPTGLSMYFASVVQCGARPRLTASPRTRMPAWRGAGCNYTVTQFPCGRKMVAPTDGRPSLLQAAFRYLFCAQGFLGAGERTDRQCRGPRQGFPSKRCFAGKRDAQSERPGQESHLTSHAPMCHDGGSGVAASHCVAARKKSALQAAEPEQTEQ